MKGLTWNESVRRCSWRSAYAGRRSDLRPGAAPPPAAAPRRRRRPRPRQPAPPRSSPPRSARRQFQDGLKYAYVNIQRIAAESAEARRAAEKVKALNEQKVSELNEKNKALQAAQQKLERAAAC